MATTREEYLELIYGYAKYHGQPWIEWQDQAKLRAFVTRELQAIVEDTKILYDDNVTFDTTSSDDGTYDLLNTDATVGTAMSSAVLEPELVLVEDSPLLDYNGLPGLISVAEANDFAYDYRTTTRVRPQFACLFPPKTLRLIPRPDAAYDVTISGWIQHFDLDGATVTDSTEMNLDARSVKGSAMAIAGELIMVGAQGAALEAARALVNAGRSQLVKASGRAATFLQGPTIRGRRLGSIYTLS